MADVPSELTVTYSKLQEIVGDFIGVGLTGGTGDDATRLENVIQSGYRKYLLGQPLNGSKKHKWSWLTPVTSLSTVNGQADYDLPYDCGAIIGSLTWGSVAEARTYSIPLIGESMIRAMRQGVTSSSRPTYAAERAKRNLPGVGQRRELLLYPTPDAAYTLSFKMSLNTDVALSAANKYPAGGAMYGECLIAACMAVAESRFYAGQTQKQAEYAMALAAAVDEDLSSAPDTVGMIGNPGSSLNGHCSNRRIYHPQVGEQFYFNGILTE